MGKRLSLVVTIISLLTFEASAVSGYRDAAEDKYPSIIGTKLDNCRLCHTNAPSRNPYGAAYGGAGHNFAAIENLDSDGDGFTNIAEIQAGTFPGNASDYSGSPQCGCAPGAKSELDLKAAYDEAAQVLGCRKATTTAADKQRPLHDSAGNIALFGCVCSVLAFKGRRR